MLHNIQSCCFYWTQIRNRRKCLTHIFMPHWTSLSCRQHLLQNWSITKLITTNNTTPFWALFFLESELFFLTDIIFRKDLYMFPLSKRAQIKSRKWLGPWWCYTWAISYRKYTNLFSNTSWKLESGYQKQSKIWYWYDKTRGKKTLYNR